LKETKAISSVLKLCDDKIFDDNDKYHHHTYLIIQKRNARQCAMIIIMGDLISALSKRIIQIVQIENRPSFCCEFVPYFELDGGIYSIAYGTIAAVSNHTIWR
jgi:NADH:ubiquinone oxidoreductase subunit B-like Fe-S oxidoreductase